MHNITDATRIHHLAEQGSKVTSRNVLKRYDSGDQLITYARTRTVSNHPRRCFTLAERTTFRKPLSSVITE